MNSLRRCSAMLLCFLVLLAWVTGCGQQAPAPTPAPTPAPPTPTPAPSPSPPAEDDSYKYGGILYWTYDFVFSAPDPHAEPLRMGLWYCNYMLSDTLVVMNEKGDVLPWLATRWEHTPDHKVYTFFLRDDVIFHDGTPFNAAAAKFSFERLAGLPVSKPPVIGNIERMTAVSDYVLEIEFKKPDPIALELLTHGALVMISPTAVEKLGDGFRYNPVGTGPFKFKEWSIDEYYCLERFDDYWGGKPYLDGVCVIVHPSREVQAMMVEAGEAHMQVFTREADAQRLRKLGFGFDHSAGLSHRNLTLNNHIAPTDDVLVRRAINYATNRQEYIDTNYEGLAKPLVTGVASDSWGHDPEVAANAYHFDKTKAAQLLDEAGWKLAADGWRYKDGQRLRLNALTESITQRTITKLEIFQEQMRQVGIQVEITLWERPAYLEMRLKAKENPYAGFHITTTGTSTGSMHPARAAWLYYSRTAGPDFAHFVDEIDDAIEALRWEFDRDKIIQLSSEFQRLWVEHALYVPIYNPGYNLVWSKHLKGDWIRDAQGSFLMMHKAWLEAEGRIVR